ncbi:MAG: hypothetical protein FJ299_09295 [Planctomycetes bacterium]|nr:hypothetical protein [Planctomycetota bacterium]
MRWHACVSILLIGVGLAPAAWSADRTAVRKKSIREGLLWLLRHQEADGSWAAMEMDARCTAKSPCWPKVFSLSAEPEGAPDEELPRASYYDVGLTGLALLGILGAGIGPDSKVELTDPQSGVKYSPGERLRSGLNWLVSGQQADGSVAPEQFMYCEAIAAAALAEACRQPGGEAWMESAQKSVHFLASAQKDAPDGGGKWGWRYGTPRRHVEQLRAGEVTVAQYTELKHDADTSVTAWCVKALDSAQLAGLDVPQEVLDGASLFLESVLERKRGEYTGRAGYFDVGRAGDLVTGPRDSFVYYPEALSAMAMSARLALDLDPYDPFLVPRPTPSRNDCPRRSTNSRSTTTSGTTARSRSRSTPNGMACGGYAAASGRLGRRACARVWWSCRTRRT